MFDKNLKLEIDLAKFTELNCLLYLTKFNPPVLVNFSDNHKIGYMKMIGDVEETITHTHTHNKKTRSK